jgi:uncharacterized protein (DUF1501 family)
MDSMTRRRFLLAAAGAGGTALAAGAGVISWNDLSRHAASNPKPAGSKVLVLVTLYGGNDGLNTVIPYTDPAYRASRSQLAYSEPDVLTLDSTFAFNPALTGIHSLWQNQRLAIVRGVGYPNPDHSHFRSMDIWQTASPAEPVNTGWIGRWLDTAGDDPVRAVNIGSVLPPLAVGAKAAADTLPFGKAKPLSLELAAAIKALGQQDQGDTAAEAAVRASCRAERQVAATFSAIVDPAGSGSAADEQSAGGSAGGQGALQQQLDLVARCVKAGVPTSVYCVSLGGFDTHADEKGTQQTQLAALDTAVTSFLKDMATDPHGKDVVLMIYTEFGRRVAANGSQGTDHGTAGPVFLAGVPVKGGYYGVQPSLTNLTNGDLKVTTDFRAIYAELVAKVLDTDPARVLDRDRPHLGLIA